MVSETTVRRPPVAATPASWCRWRHLLILGITSSMLFLLLIAFIVDTRVLLGLILLAVILVLTSQRCLKLCKASKVRQTEGENQDPVRTVSVTVLPATTRCPEETRQLLELKETLQKLRLDHDVLLSVGRWNRNGRRHLQTNIVNLLAAIQLVEDWRVGAEEMTAGDMEQLQDKVRVWHEESLAFRSRGEFTEAPPPELPDVQSPGPSMALVLKPPAYEECDILGPPTYSDMSPVKPSVQPIDVTMLHLPAVHYYALPPPALAWEEGEIRSVDFRAELPPRYSET